MRATRDGADGAPSAAHRDGVVTMDLSTFEATSYFPSPHAFALGPFHYLEHLRRAKDAVGIPVMASLNGATPGGWIEYARLMRKPARTRWS
jgi:hypothetical protein